MRSTLLRHRWLAVVVGIKIIALSGCGSPVSEEEAATVVTAIAATSSTTSAAEETATSHAPTTTTVTPTTGWAVESVLPETVAVALAEPGEYGVGKREYMFVDPTREDREVVISVHYPAVTAGSLVMSDTEPNVLAAPYPVVVGSDQMADVTGSHLASHGFIFLGGVGQSTWSTHPSWKMLDYPPDLIVGLDSIENLASDDPLAGIAATDHAGVIDYSFGSWTALMLAGGRVDPPHYESTCASAPNHWTNEWYEYVCGYPDGWAEMVTRRVEKGVATPEGLWEPMGDDRVRAAMPMGPEGSDLTGPDGLAGISIPVLYMAAGDDAINPYPLAPVPLFDNTNPDLASMITFADAGHMMVFDADVQIQFKRFALAFFGYHLAGIDEFAPPLTSEFVERQAPYLEPHPSYGTLIWGADQQANDCGEYASITPGRAKVPRTGRAAESAVGDPRP